MPSGPAEPWLSASRSEPVRTGRTHPRVDPCILPGTGSVARWEAYLTPPRVSGPRTEGSRMPLEDVSDRGNKVYDTMKSAGITAEDKRGDAEAMRKMAKLARSIVVPALQV